MLPIAQRRIDPRSLAPGCGHQLRRSHRAKRVAGEIAEQAVVPMDVLQAASGVVGRHDAEQRLDPVVPRGRQIVQPQIAANQRLFQPEAQDHVRRIGHFVGVHANEAAMHPPPETRQIETFDIKIIASL